MLKAPDDGVKPDSLEPVTPEELTRLQAIAKERPLSARDWERIRRMSDHQGARYTLT